MQSNGNGKCVFYKKSMEEVHWHNILCCNFFISNICYSIDENWWKVKDGFNIVNLHSRSTAEGKYTLSLIRIIQTLNFFQGIGFSLIWWRQCLVSKVVCIDVKLETFRALADTMHYLKTIYLFILSLLNIFSWFIYKTFVKMKNITFVQISSCIWWCIIT